MFRFAPRATGYREDEAFDWRPAIDLARQALQSGQQLQQAVDAIQADVATFAAEYDAVVEQYRRRAEQLRARLDGLRAQDSAQSDLYSDVEDFWTSTDETNDQFRAIFDEVLSGFDGHIDDAEELLVDRGF